MYLVGNPITLKWVIDKTSRVIPQDTFDVTVFDPNGLSEYIDNAALTYTAPTATAAGELTYTISAGNPGLWRVILSQGAAASYNVLDIVKLHVHDQSPIVPATLITLPVADPRLGVTYPLVAGSTDTPHTHSAIATDGNKIMIAGSHLTGGNGYWTANMDMSNLTFTAFPQATGSLTGLAYGNGRWVMSQQFGPTWWSADGISWTEGIIAGGWPNISIPNCFYAKNLDTHYVMGNEPLYSTDGGVNWTKQWDTQAWGGLKEAHCWVENPLDTNYTLLGLGQERVTVNPAQSQIMNAWTEHWDGALWPSVPGFYFIDEQNGVLRGYDHTSHVSAVSSDGTSWVNVPLLGDAWDAAATFIKYFPRYGKWFATTQGSTHYESLDGITWTITATSPFAGFNYVREWHMNYFFWLPNGGYVACVIGAVVSGRNNYLVWEA